MASIKLKGDTSGEVTIQAPSVAGTTTLNLPATSSTLATQNALGVRNLIINGDMRISQRGTSFTSNLENTYTLDRWKIHDRLCTSRSVTQESFSTGSVSTFGKEVSNYLRATFSNDSGATPPFVMHAIEDVKSVAGETVTISFWAKADSAQDIELHYSQQFGGGGSSEVTAIIDTFTLTTSWAKYTTTVTIPSISGKTVGTSSNLRIDWRMPANTAITYDMTLVQLEANTTATPFENRPYDMELERCKRYCYVLESTSVTGRQTICSACSHATTAGIGFLQLPVEMRALPSLSLSAVGDWAVHLPGVNRSQLTALALGANGDQKSLYITFSHATHTSYGSAKYVFIDTWISGTGQFILSAEL